MRKPRPDSRLKTLPEEQQAKLTDWLLSGIPYHRVRELVQEEFNVATSMAALSGYWQEFCGPALIARRRRAVSTAEEIAADAAAKPGQFDAATIDALKQRAFELAIAPGVDPKQVTQVFSLVLKARDQEISKEDLQFRMREFEQRIKDDAQKVFDAFMAEVSGDQVAEELVAKLQQRVMEKMQGSAEDGATTKGTKDTKGEA